MYIYVTKISLVWRLPDPKYLEEHSWCFLFALRCHECDGRLLVHHRSSATHVLLLAPVFPFGLRRAGCIHMLTDW